MPHRDDRLYIQEIIDAIERILEYTRGGKTSFDSNLVQDAVAKNLMVIGEAAKQLSEDARAQTPGIPWRRVAGMRDRLIHGYFSIDLDVVWNVVEVDLPQMYEALKEAPPT